MNPDGTATWLHHDQLGSVRLATKTTDGAESLRRTFDAYGTTASQSAASGAKQPLLSYAGQYTDTETGYQYLRARYYDPTTGQFLSLDPLVVMTEQGYSYAGHNPSRFTDPTGLLFGVDISLDDALGVVENGALVVGTVADGVGMVAAIVPGGQGVAAGAFSVGRGADLVGAAATCTRVATGGRDMGDCGEAIAYVAIPGALENVVAPGTKIHKGGKVYKQYSQGDNIARGGLAWAGNGFQWSTHHAGTRLRSQCS